MTATNSIIIRNATKVTDSKLLARTVESDNLYYKQDLSVVVRNFNELHPGYEGALNGITMRAILAGDVSMLNKTKKTFVLVFTEEIPMLEKIMASVKKRRAEKRAAARKEAKEAERIEKVKRYREAIRKAEHYYGDICFEFVGQDLSKLEMGLSEEDQRYCMWEAFYTAGAVREGTEDFIKEAIDFWINNPYG